MVGSFYPIRRQFSLLDSSYFTNRALCYLNLKKWDQAGQDCRRALDLDKKNIKANYFLGKALFALGKYDEAIKVLTRANEYAFNNKLSYGDEITQMLRQSRRERFRIEEVSNCISFQVNEYLHCRIRE